MKKQRIETLCVQAGYTPKEGEPRVAPIIQSTTFAYDEPQNMANLFDLTASGYFYSRLANPTCGFLEEKVSALEGGVGGLATSSGQAASTISLLNVCKTGDHVVSAAQLYGGTYNLFAVTLKKLGIDFTFVSAHASKDEIEKCIRPNTKAIFAESISNPAVVVLNFENFAYVAKKHKILFIIDNTFPTPIICRPFEHGANVIVHASTKYLDGHATSVGGLVVDGGNFEFEGNERYKDFYTPDESYHGTIYTKSFGKAAYIVKARAQLMRDLGVCMAPMNAFLTNMGCETLHLRMERTSQNALKLAKALKGHKKIEYVNYPALEGDPSFELTKKYLTNGWGSGVMTIGTVGGREKAIKFMKNIKIMRMVTHVSDLRSCVLHPASATHRQLSDEALLKAGVKPNLLRLSIGIENGDDIVEDILNALDKI